MIKSMRAAGCVVNCNIVISVAKGIALVNDRVLLKECGGSLLFHYSGCKSIFRRLGFCQGSKAISLSSGFLKIIDSTFYLVIKEVVDAYDVPEP